MTGKALFFAVALDWSGCGGGSGSGSKPTAASVMVTPSNADVYQGMTAKFQAQVVGESNQTVAWSIEQGGLGTIDNTGLYTAPRDASGGPFHIVATSQAIPSAKGSAAVAVLVPQVTVAPASATLAPGRTQMFTATVKGLINTDVTWAIQELEGGSISDTGFYEAPQITGLYHVVATSVEDAAFSGSASINVTASSGRFTPTGSMQNGRGLHTGTLLPSGRVLMAGGSKRLEPVCVGGIASAETYDPAAGSFTATGSMTSPRYAHTATSFPEGKVLVTGGFGTTRSCFDEGEPALRSTELYDPSTGSFQATGSMLTGRGGHTATLLSNGKVLVAGGGDQGGGALPFYGTASNTAELYDPGTGIFKSTGNMVTARLGHTATPLPNGRVLIVGGVSTSTSQPTVSAEIYDAVTGTFTKVANMLTARSGHTATSLQDGRVLIVGGYTDFTNSEFHASVTAEIYNPATGSFSSVGSMSVARFLHSAILLPNGMVLVAGGSDSSAELYDPTSNSFSSTGAMETIRAGHSATLLLNGQVLVAGGGSFSPLNSAEVYK